VCFPGIHVFAETTMVHILYELDHQNRAVALGNAIGAQCSEVSSPPQTIAGLDTLIFWGHGSIGGLCGKQPDEIKKVVRDWKVQNSKLKTVEVITCNSRHGVGKHEPYILRLKAEMRGTSFRSKTRGVTLKTVPVNVSGAMGGFSILLADHGTRTWCYVTAKSDVKGGDSYMMDAQWDLKMIGKTCGDNLAIAAPRLEARYHGRALDRNFTLNYGYFGTLRYLLSEI